MSHGYWSCPGRCGDYPSEAEHGALRTSPFARVSKVGVAGQHPGTPQSNAPPDAPVDIQRARPEYSVVVSVDSAAQHATPTCTTCGKRLHVAVQRSACKSTGSSRQRSAAADLPQRNAARRAESDGVTASVLLLKRSSMHCLLEYLSMQVLLVFRLVFSQVLTERNLLGCLGKSCVKT